jgi:hypothetical protein
MPFLEPIVYPPERNKDYIKQAIYVANSLGSWWRRINEQKKIKKIKIRFSTAIVVVHSINQTTILTRSQQKAKPAKSENSQKMSHLEIKTQIIVTSNLNIHTLCTSQDSQHQWQKHNWHSDINESTPSNYLS